MINDNQTNTVYFSDKLTKPKCAGFCNNLVTILNKHNITHHFLENTNDIWCRDYMPVQVREDKFVEYVYDPDYLELKKDRRLKSYPDFIMQQLPFSVTKTDLILDGGNVIKYGNKVIMTDKIIPENSPKYLKVQVLDKLYELFDVDQIILVPWNQKEDEYGHADGMVRFLDESSVLIDSFYANEKESGPIGEKFRSILKKHHLEIVPLQFSTPYNRQSPKNWGYVNFLQLKDLLLIPKFGIEEDTEAEQQFHTLFPGYSSKGQIETIDSNAIIKHGGVLNCVSWNVMV